MRGRRGSAAFKKRPEIIPIRNESQTGNRTGPKQYLRKRRKMGGVGVPKSNRNVDPYNVAFSGPICHASLFRLLTGSSTLLNWPWNRFFDKLLSLHYPSQRNSYVNDITYPFHQTLYHLYRTARLLNGLSTFVKVLAFIFGIIIFLFWCIVGAMTVGLPQQNSLME